MISFVTKLFTDPNPQMRERSLDTLIEMYKHIGERMRTELRRKQFPEAKLANSLLSVKVSTLIREPN